jgi:single stranded DNA-binding protein
LNKFRCYSSHDQHTGVTQHGKFQSSAFIGRLVKDPDLQVTGTGKPFTRFSLAVDQGKDNQGKDRGAMWLNVTTWDKLAEITEKYATKGVQVFVQGKLQICAYEDKQGAKQQAVDTVANVVFWTRSRMVTDRQRRLMMGLTLLILTSRESPTTDIPPHFFGFQGSSPHRLTT